MLRHVAFKRKFRVKTNSPLPPAISKDDENVADELTTMRSSIKSKMKLTGGRSLQWMVIICRQERYLTTQNAFVSTIFA